MSEPVRPTVRVGIVSWNTAELLDRCLAALPAALDGADAEIVVVDNASGDDSVVRARAHPGVRVEVNDQNLGYARAMNRALRSTGARTLVALNPDTVPPPGSLRRLVETSRASGAGVVLPLLRNPDGSLQHSVHRFPSRAVAAVLVLPARFHRGRLGRRYWLEGAAPVDRGGPVDWGIGAVHVIDASAVDDPDHVYTERWFMYVEDLELCHRLARRGRGTWLDASVEVEHVGNAAGAQRWGAERERRWWWATYDFVHETTGPSVLRQLAALNLLASVVHLVGAAVSSLPRRPVRAGRRRTAAELARVVDVHLRVMLAGARAVTDERAGRQPEVVEPE